MDDTPRFARAQLNWRDLPENRYGAHERWTWLDSLAIEWEVDADMVWRQLYWSLHESLSSEGIDDETASRVALRATRQACLMLRAHFSQSEVTEALSFSKRTAGADVARIRAVLREGRVREARSRRLEPVPVRAEDRVAIDLRAAPSRRTGQDRRRGSA
jgi:hypothetical protein